MSPVFLVVTAVEQSTKALGFIHQTTAACTHLCQILNSTIRHLLQDTLQGFIFCRFQTKNLKDKLQPAHHLLNDSTSLWVHLKSRQRFIWKIQLCILPKSPTASDICLAAAASWILDAMTPASLESRCQVQSGKVASPCPSNVDQLVA